MRYKRRYFCVELIQASASLEYKLKSNDLVQELIKLIEKFFGDFGIASIQPSFSLVYFNSDTNLAIFRVARQHRADFHQLLSLVCRVDSTELAFKVIHVSGSIKQCKKYLIRHFYKRIEEFAENESKFF